MSFCHTHGFVVVFRFPEELLKKKVHLKTIFHHRKIYRYKVVLDRCYTTSKHTCIANIFLVNSNEQNDSRISFLNTYSTIRNKLNNKTESNTFFDIAT